MVARKYKKMLVNTNFYVIGRPQVAPTVWWKPTDKPKFEKNKNILLREVLLMTLRDMV